MKDKFHTIITTDDITGETRKFSVELRRQPEGCSIAFFSDQTVLLDANWKMFEISCDDLQHWLDIIDEEQERRSKIQQAIILRAFGGGRELEGETELNDEDDDPLYHGQFDQLP